MLGGRGGPGGARGGKPTLLLSSQGLNQADTLSLGRGGPPGRGGPLGRGGGPGRGGFNQRGRGGPPRGGAPRP